jgi:hypothetical protein
MSGEQEGSKEICTETTASLRDASEMGQSQYLRCRKNHSHPFCLNHTQNE